MVHDEETSVYHVLAGLATVAIFTVVAVVLRHRGVRVVVFALLFVFALCSTQLAMSVLVRDFGYNFPGFVTCLHFGSVCVVCTLYWLWVGEPHKILPLSISLSRYMRTIVPAALSQPVSVVFNNKAMVFVGAGLVAIIGTLSPIATALLSRVFGRKLAYLSWVGVLVAFAGGVVISWGEATAVDTNGASHDMVVTGLIFAFASVAGRALKIVVMDVLLAPLSYSSAKEEEPLHIWHVFVLVYPLATAASLIYAFATENAIEAWEGLTPQIVGVIMGTVVSALCLNFLGGVVLRDLGANFQQIIGKLNTLCIASFSVAFLGERLPPVAILGSAFVLGGVAFYEAGERMQSEKQADADSDCSSLKDDSSDSDGSDESENGAAGCNGA